MALDLSKIIDQITGMVASLKFHRNERLEQLHHALDVLHSQSNNLEELAKKIEASKTTWLVARLVEPIDCHYQPQLAPEEFTVIATDGSHIDVDRHQPTHCYLINIGSVLLRYGVKPDASLDSIPHLYAGNEELAISAPGIPGREQPVEGDLLGIKRGVEECRRLAELASDLPPESTGLGLIDGSLILWNLEAYPEFVGDILLEKGLLAYLEQIRKLNKDRQITVASYISYPRSTDVVNDLRVALCPRDTVDSDRCAECQTRECDFVAGIRDRELFAELLKSGERSALFISPSKIQKRYGEHVVHFFYLKLDEEIARIEIPQWVAQDEKLLNLTHTLILDQCRRGQGYPVALSEAHEKAVVTGADRESFWQMVESSLIEGHLPTLGSAKSQSKKTRWV
ncbi:MAG: DNA double-strand break repair nuclease NurA [Dehalococcoidales bacterium]|nr:DNA double-strand break repair nuclease NurA [Dehalococcoidales bacterium]